MILIVNTTSDTSVTEELLRGLKDRDIAAEVVEAASLKISPCIGCNHCWLKTPGICSIKDDYEEILKRILPADQLWVISNTALGFLDHRGKNIYDRIIPIATMDLCFADGQMRHVLRYDTAPDVGIIYLGEADRDYLER